MQLGNNIHVCFVGLMMAKSFKRSLQDDMEDDSSVPKRTCIAYFNDCKHEEKFIYLHEIQRPEGRFDKIHEIGRRRLAESAASVDRMD